MNISKVMDKESESVWLSLILVADVLSDLLVGEAVLVARVSWEPVYEGWDNLSNVLVVELEFWVIIDWTTLIEEWVVDEVPSWLVAATLGLDLIGEGWALYEWEITLQWGHWWVWAGVDLK